MRQRNGQEGEVGQDVNSRKKHDHFVEFNAVGFEPDDWIPRSADRTALKDDGKNVGSRRSRDHKGNGPESAMKGREVEDAAVECESAAFHQTNGWRVEDFSYKDRLHTISLSDEGGVI